MKAYHNVFEQTTDEEIYPTHKNSVLERLRHHLPALFGLVVLVCLAYPLWFSSGAMTFDDLTRLNVPQRMFVGNMLRHGQLPLWNPYNFGGQPFLGAGQSGPLYLPNLVFALLPIETALKVSYAFHTLLAAVSVYLIGYHLTKRRVAAVSSGVVFATSGFMIGHQIHTQMFDAMSLVPLALYFLIRLLTRPSWQTTVALGVVVAFEIYAGHPQVSFYLLLTILICALTIIFLTPFLGFFQRISMLLGAGALSLLLSAPQWLPTLELIPYSDRSQVSKVFLLKGSMPLNGLLQFLSPFTTGGGYTGTPLTGQGFAAAYGSALFWEYTCYVGLAALLLALTAVVSGFLRHPLVPALLLVGTVGILLSLGANGLLQDVLLYFPGFDLFRIPARYTVLTQLSIAILTAVGMAVVMEAIQYRKKAPLITLSVFSLLAIGTLVVEHAHGSLRSAPELAWVVPICIAAITMILPWLLWIGRPARSAVTGLILSLIVCSDVVVQAAGWSGFVNDGTLSYNAPNQTANYIKTQLTTRYPLQKVFALPDTSLAFDESLAFSIPTLNGYDSLESVWYADYVNLTWSAGDVVSEPRSMMDALGIRFLVSTNHAIPYWATEPKGVSSVEQGANVPKAANALEIRVGATNDASVPDYAPLLSVTLLSGDQHLTELLTGLPHQSFMIPLPSDWPRQGQTQVIVKNETWNTQVQVLETTWMTSGKSPSSTLISDVWLSPEPWKPVASNGLETVWENQAPAAGAYVTMNPDDPLTDIIGTVKSISFNANRQVWQVNASHSGGELVLGQTFDPGWTATVNGQPVRPEQVGGMYGYLLTGIPLSAGKQTVVLTYHPLGFRAGVVLFLTGLVMIGAMVAYVIVKSFRARNKRQSRRL
ncbi:YfhO family protein [Alicyclobacillus ferrooxydans]|uniref:Membrane protein 6-pyruvoyl-tetrahydropterin synthase-related domain-containing protein n=1 Tax=Alicyclobacillus ferrooxydans TaxID=471514 RepID=A0A0P9EJX8_9BACL|nr:YfhO family protein [Alicyclobacillus ferrooxydans]KPV43332.1 hypothetical protein AN477_12795 [Alicyclobacillus ferrooxydans]